MDSHTYYNHQLPILKIKKIINNIIINYAINKDLRFYGEKLEKCEENKNKKYMITKTKTVGKPSQ